jgi:hypothetical protein
VLRDFVTIIKTNIRCQEIINNKELIIIIFIGIQDPCRTCSKWEGDKFRIRKDLKTD